MSRVLPILFNTEMVLAILDGRKTVTRRIVNPYPDWFDCGLHNDRNTPMKAVCPPEADWQIKQPYQTEDILYVRETYAKHPRMKKYYYRADSECSGKSTADGCPEAYDRTDNCELCEWANGYIKWKPSIHMPKDAARIFLKVIDVRVERLQDITAKQAENEGTGNLFLEDVAFGEKKYQDTIEEDGYEGCIKTQFACLWDSTCKKSLQVHGWDANPWVWVIEFERCEKPVDSFDNGWGDAIHELTK